MTIVQSAGWAREQWLERRQEVASLRVDPDRPVAAEHRDRISFVGKDPRVARDGVALEAHKPHRVRIVADAAANDGFYPFVRKALVEPVNEVEAHLFRQSLDESVSGGAAHDAHGVALNRYQSGPRSGHPATLCRDPGFAHAWE